MCLQREESISSELAFQVAFRAIAWEVTAKLS